MPLRSSLPYLPSAAIVAVGLLFVWWMLATPERRLPNLTQDQHIQQGTTGQQPDSERAVDGSRRSVVPADSQPARQPHGANGEHNKSNDAPKEFTWIDTGAQWLMAVAGILALAVSVGALVLLKGTLTASVSAARAATDQVRTTRNADRPYLTPVKPELRGFAAALRDPYKVITVHFGIANIGRGTGFLTSYGIAHEICRKGLQGALTLDKHSDFPRLPLSGNGAWDTQTPVRAFAISSAAMADIMRGDTVLYIYGYNRYSDFYGVTRRTGYMYELVPNGEASTLTMCPHAMWYDVEEG